MFCAIHPDYTCMGKGSTIQKAVENWVSESGVDVDDDIFDGFTFVEGNEVKVEREISYKVVKNEKI